MVAVCWLVWPLGKGLPASFYKEQGNTRKASSWKNMGGEATLNFPLLWFQSEKK